MFACLYYILPFLALLLKIYSFHCFNFCSRYAVLSKLPNLCPVWVKPTNKTNRISEGDKACVSSAQLTCWVCCTLSQFSHSKRLPLSCDIWWRMRLDFQLKALGHWSHLYSLSSVWTIMCCPRLDKEGTSSLVHSDKWTVYVECVHFYEH